MSVNFNKHMHFWVVFFFFLESTTLHYQSQCCFGLNLKSSYKKPNSVLWKKESKESHLISHILFLSNLKRESKIISLNYGNDVNLKKKNKYVIAGINYF